MRAVCGGVRALRRAKRQSEEARQQAWKPQLHPQALVTDSSCEPSQCNYQGRKQQSRGLRGNIATPNHFLGAILGTELRWLKPHVHRICYGFPSSDAYSRHYADPV